MERPSPQSQPVRFGLFELDVRSGELRKEGIRIRLQEQPFQILAILLENQGQVVSREELRKRLWPEDTFVDFDHSLNKAITKLREALGDSAEHPQFIETLAKRGYRFFGHSKISSRHIRSLLVLPLENLSRDPEQEFFAEGMTEALINTMAKIGALRVTSRTTAMRYKKTDKTLSQIAHELNVDAIVEGAVLRSADRVRVSAQLVDAYADAHLWAESYDRDLRDVLALQSEVAQAIARQVQVTLTPQEQAQFAQVHRVNPEAYEAYLKGRYHWNRRSGEELPRAVQCFQQAIVKDSDYAAAYAGLADSLAALGIWGFVSPKESCGEARGFGLRALELDPALGEAHASLAWVDAWYERDFTAAEKEFERSIELNPRYPTAHYFFGFYLGLMGRYEEAYTECKRALRLEPLSSAMHWGFGFVLLLSRRYDRAIEEADRSLELDPAFVGAHALHGWAYPNKSRHDLAIASLRKAVELSQGASQWVGSLGEAYANAGYKDEARKILHQLNDLSKQRYVTPYIVARIHAALGEHDDAFQWLETAFQERATWMAFLKTDPLLDSLRPDVRFQDLLRRMNFPSEGPSAR